ncbi:MAG: VOC family protein [Alphaproteobacteria bacterium]|jgi:catechol 2,3-dioxygenase-like lactoylglutathione lyase family enzyme|nr:VOC family protein [Alphaproteobacteria bacterium]
MSEIEHTSHLEKPAGDPYGRQLRGFGVNLLVTDVLATVRFLVEVMGIEQVYSNPDFAILRHEGMEFMLHADGTYHSNPLLGLTGDGAVRGVGVELRLYGIDPDAAAARARARGDHILQEPTDKPHGLREAFIMDPDGYLWVPGRAKD